MDTILRILESRRVKQDKDIEDKDGSQPAKYHSGLSKDTKQKRDAHFKAKKSGPAPGDDEGKTKKSVHTKKFEKQFGEETVIVEKITGLVNKAEKSGISYGILKKVYDRGLAAYKTGHRPGTTAPQWAFARVNSFITKGSGTWGKADKDLANKVRGESFVADEDFTMDEACWDGYKQVGTKKKGGKVVPNCVPEETEIEENAKVKAMLSKMKGVSSAQAQLIAQIPIPVLTQISQALGQLVMGEDTVEEDRNYKKEYENYQGKPEQKAMMKSARKSIKDYDAKNKNKNEESEVEEDRDYKKEYENYQGKPEQIKRRAARNSARNQLKDNKDIKGKDVHHKDNNPMNNDKSNLSIVSKNYNRKEPRLRERLVKQGIIKNAKRK